MEKNIKQNEIMEWKRLEEKFKAKWRKMTNEEQDEYNIWFGEEVKPRILDNFYGGYHPKGKYAEEKRERFADYIYLYMIAYDNQNLDERYDQPIFYEARKYAEALKVKL